MISYAWMFRSQAAILGVKYLSHRYENQVTHENEVATTGRATSSSLQESGGLDPL